MRKQRSPQGKKALSYKKDRYYKAEYDHGFRRNWPIKEAMISREYRRKVGQLLDSLERGNPEEETEQLNAQAVPIHRQIVRKWKPVPTLKERSQHHQEIQIHRVAYNYFKSPYQREEHREAFAGFLQALTKGVKGWSYKLALRFNEFLQPPELPIDTSKPGEWEKRAEIWLKAFFEDEPEWEIRLRTWIRKTVTGLEPAE